MRTKNEPCIAFKFDFLNYILYNVKELTSTLMKYYEKVNTMELAKKYNLYINDQSAHLEKIRVSLFPFNRHWPGFQRPLNQTEVTAFASFDLV